MPEKTVTVGRKVPDFSLPVTGGGNWKLSAARGSRLSMANRSVGWPMGTRTSPARAWYTRVSVVVRMPRCR